MTGVAAKATSIGAKKKMRINKKMPGSLGDIALLIDSMYSTALSASVISGVSLSMEVAFAATPVKANQSFTVFTDSVVLSVKEVDNIKNVISTLQDSNEKLTLHTNNLQKKIDFYESQDYKDQNFKLLSDYQHDNEVYKKLVDEYEVTLVKFTDQVTTLEDALKTSKESVAILEERNKSLQQRLHRAKTTRKLTGYLMFALGAVIFHNK